MGALSAALCALLLGGLSPARAASPDNFSSDMMSLNYYAHHGVLELNPHLTATLRDETSFSNNTDTHVQFNQIYLGAVYGILPRVRIGLNDTVLWDQVSQTAPTSTNPQNASTSDGPSNPSFTAGWRLLDDSSSGLSGDVAASFSPRIGHKISANASLDTIGNNVGNTTAGASATLYWRILANEFSVAYGHSWNFGGDTESTTASSSFSVLPFSSATWTFTERLHLGPRFYVGAQLTDNLGNSQVTNVQNGTSKVVFVDPYVDYLFAFGFRPEPYYVLAVSLAFDQTPSTTVSSDGSVLVSRTHYLVGQISFLHQVW